ncbi:MAG TPA: hypothetical protein VFE82_00990 [Ramlibacter sp.]|jgi:hypothetical protein|uniref:hypothetical protein n=1 Tax=Ramlibacter sp. TaxID=1917967 RepID=UPI002D417437|nr:hypothetical protein [Ramlibacter sp.]HZY17021.1 hypothetical protein [Ramlibacter sp.]
MNSFEQLIKGMLEEDGYWVRSSYKAELTAAEKMKIGRPTSPRWEVDLLAYRGDTNEVLVVECKSYLDSAGVSYKSLCEDGKGAGRYKLFTEPGLRQVVFGRIKRQLVAAGAVRPAASITLCLAAGNIRSERDRSKIAAVFKKRGWMLFDHSWMVDRLQEASRGGYEDNVATAVAKLLLKDPRVASALEESK